MASQANPVTMQKSILRSSDGKTGSHLTLRQVLKDLVQEGWLTQDQAQNIFKSEQNREEASHPLVAIARQDLRDAFKGEKRLTLDWLTEWLARKVDLPHHRIDPLHIDVPTVTAVVSHAYAAARRILPIEVTPKRVRFAVADPVDTGWINELERVLRRNIERVVANPDEIQRYIDEFYSLSRSVKSATRDEPFDAAAIQNLEQLVELGRRGELDANDHHVVHIVDWLLQYAFEQRASDIHVEPRRDIAEVRFRIDGVLHPVYEMPPSVAAGVQNRIKTIGRMDVAERRRPQDGRLKTKTPEGTEIELRLSSIPTAMGEKLVLRIFDPSVLQRTSEQLGLTEQEFNRWQKLVNEPHGIILVTGPTGSGKTTTLYSTLKLLATKQVNVCTIEDPIEMVEPAFNQVQAQPGIDLTFASGVRSLLRQDPDIIMIGEIRDLETAEMAIQAALTGHLVLSTLHTNDAASAITRLMEIGVPSYLINATLLGVMAQRLVRTLCVHCKQPEPFNDPRWSALVHPWKADAPEQVQTPTGCSECRHTGYLGRIGLYEMLLMSPEIRKLVHQNTDLDMVRTQTIQENMLPLRISGVKKIHSGLTTLEEVYRVIPKETQI